MGIDAPTFAVMVSLAMFGLSLIIQVRGGAWNMADRFASLEKKISDAMTAHRTAVDGEVERLRNEVAEGRRAFGAVVEEVQRRFGETIAAMQAKIHQFETWSRDEFVRRKSFDGAITRVETVIADRDQRAGKRLDTIEAKLDGLGSLAGKIDALTQTLNTRGMGGA